MLQCVAGALDRSSKLSIATETVAKAMLKNSLKSTTEKTQTLEHADLIRIAKE